MGAWTPRTASEEAAAPENLCDPGLGVTLASLSERDSANVTVDLGALRRLPG